LLAPRIPDVLGAAMSNSLGFAPRWSRDGLDFWMLPTTNTGSE
jgi:hypothetical protein